MIGSVRRAVPRIVVIGSTSVGKTALIHQIIFSQFDPMTSPTTGTAFYQYISDHPTHSEVQLWDTAGMERFHSLNTAYYRDAAGAILVFDLTNYVTFQEIGSWLTEFMSQAHPNPAMVLCGNKCDLGGAMEVDLDDVRLFCQEHHMSYYQTSAVSGNGVSEMVHAVLSHIPVFQVPVSTEILLPEKPSGCCY
jgi:small GTP-binding protein